MARRWTQEEIDGWLAFFEGRVEVPPTKDRSIDAALQKVQPPDPLKTFTKEDWHALWCAISPYLSQVSYLGAGAHTEFVERVQLVAAKPWLRARYEEAEPFDSALKAARRALMERRAA